VEETKYCKKCDSTKPIEDFNIDRTRPDGRAFYCSPCRSAGQYERQARTRRVRQRERYLVARELLDQMKSNPCTDCGGTFPTYVMEYDHRDPKTKRKAISTWCASGYIKGMLEEIALCDLICANCHRIRTTKMIQEGGIKMGRPRKYA
jgi:5-methylcytosine-specific restriction endonuclease McrA